MTTLSGDDVKKAAHLARIAINDAKIPEYTENLSNILNLVEQMNHVDTSEITPLAHPLDLAQRLRLDEVTEENRREQYQAIAPNVEKGLYLVPKVID